MTATHKHGKRITERAAAATTAAVALAMICGGALPAAAQYAPAPAERYQPGTYDGDPEQVDLISGQNKPGPYTLAFTNLRVNLRQKVEVYVDGKDLPADAYTVDLAKGLITFKQPLKTGSLARVSYFYDAKTAKRNADFTSAPLTLPQMNVGGTSVKLTALPGAASGGGTETRMVYGAERNLRLLGGGLTSSLLMTSGSAAASKLGFAYGNKNNGFDAGFQRTEKEFAEKAGKPLGLNEATQKLTLGGRLRPASWLGTSVSRLEIEDLNARTEKEQTAYGLNLGGTRGMPALNYARTEDEATGAAGATSSVTTEKVDLAAKLGTAALAAKQQKVATDADGKNGADSTAVAQEATLNLGLGGTSAISAKTVRNLTDTPDPKKDVTAQEAHLALTAGSVAKKPLASVAVVTGSKETATGVEEKQNLSLKLQPASVLTLSAEQKAQKTTALTATGDEGAVQESMLQTVGAELTPMPGTKLVGGVQVSEREGPEGVAKTAMTNLEATIGAGKAIEIGGGVTNRSATLAGAPTLDTTRARLALRPGAGLTLTGAYTLNPEQNGRVSQAVRHEVGLQYKLGQLELGSGYALTTLNGLTTPDLTDDPQIGEVSLSLGLRLSRFTRLDGGYKDGLLYGGGYGLASAMAARGLRSYQLGLTHNVGQALSFSMSGTVQADYAKTGTPPDQKAEAKLGVRF